MKEKENYKKIAVQIQKMNPNTGGWFDLFQCSENIVEETLLFQRKMHPESQFRSVFTGHVLPLFKTAKEAFPTYYE